MTDEQARLDEFTDDVADDTPDDDGSADRCTATTTAGERCGRPAPFDGVDTCSLHLHESDLAPGGTDSATGADRVRTDGGDPRDG